MITGFVNSHYEAIVQFLIRGPKGKQEIEAIIDTGFNGSLTLPSSLIASLGLRFDTRGRAILADGSEIFFNNYEATVIWEDKPYRVAVAEADSEPLVGMKLLNGYELTIQVVENGSVTIKTLS